MELAFQGEEILGANDQVGRLILPILDEKTTIKLTKNSQRHEFRFKIPENAGPSYSSRDVRCQYGVKATIKRGFLQRNLYRKLDVTVLPALKEGLTSLPEELKVEESGLRLLARIDQRVVLSGESLTGSLLIEKVAENAKLPSRLSFRLASIEEATEENCQHRRVLTLETQDVEVDQELEFPFTGYFEFPLPAYAEPSGSWNMFKVHYGFRVTFYDQQGKDHRASTRVTVIRDLRPWPEKGAPQGGDSSSA